MLGTSGTYGERLALVTAIPRTRPAFICGMLVMSTSNMQVMFPAIRSVMAGPDPL